MTDDSQPTNGVPKDTAPQQTGGHILVYRIRFVAAMCIAGAVFWYFGWWVARPTDPLGAVSMLMVNNGVVTMAELLGLAIVVSGIAVAICGGDTAERGPLAVAVGLATLAARGGRMDMLLLNRLASPSPDSAIDVYPVMGLMAETWLWLALIGVGMVVGKWVQGWFRAAGEAPILMEDGDGKSAWDIRMAIGALVIGFFIAWSIIAFAAGEPMAPIETGQLFFALISAFLLAALVAQWFFDLRDRIWMLVVVGLVASAAYWFGQPQHLDAAEKLHTHIPIENPLVRPLPIEYAALGAIGVLLERDFMSILFVVIGYAPRDRQAEPANA
ncbi:MAG TPA: hypothetical protein P5081_19320 [Phycisphaerae bacterium]|nr:hypothetical protein [Phycisphaerae bacterium]HRW55026.1 hypothetical protein [Phycisphaerae bacterium]